MSVKTKLLTLMESGRFDAANASISFNELNAFDGLRHELGHEVVGVKDKSLEHPSRSYSAGEFLVISGDTHAWMI